MNRIKMLCLVALAYTAGILTFIANIPAKAATKCVSCKRLGIEAGANCTGLCAPAS